MNKTFIIGKLSEAPKQITTQKGKELVSVPVRVTETFGGREMSQMFFVNAWSKDTQQKLMEAGDNTVFIEGRMTSNKKEGTDQYFWNLNASNVEYIFNQSAGTSVDRSNQYDQAIPF